MTNEIRQQIRSWLTKYGIKVIKVGEYRVANERLKRNAQIALNILYQSRITDQEILDEYNRMEKEKESKSNAIVAVKYVYNNHIPYSGFFNEFEDNQDDSDFTFDF